MQINYRATSQIANLLEKLLKIDENVVRYLTLKQNQKRLAPLPNE
nr:ribosomal protein S6 [Tsunamia transpacifica]